MLELFTTDWRTLWDGAEGQGPVGAIFTRPEIVELILDLAGYDPEASRLADRPLLEPSCGDGAFLTAVVRRLLASETVHRGSVDWDDTSLDAAIRAADISEASVRSARGMIAAQLTAAGCDEERSAMLAARWITQTDFLLEDWPTAFDFVIGNPPYVRLEDVPRRVLARYRELFATTTDRADLYVAFFERGLELLSPSGTLAFICANRFTKNRYGEALRQLIARRYRVRHYLNLEHTQPFLSDVSAYPAIIVLDRARGESTRAGTLEDLSPETLSSVRSQSLASGTPTRPVAEFTTWYPDGEPWMTTCGHEHGLLSALNDRLPTLEESGAGTRVGIGVATGADGIFVLPGKLTEVEESRQIPLLMSSDVRNDGLRWSGKYLLNPFDDRDDGSLVDLREFPGFARYLHQHEERLRSRHVARSRPGSWFRTIDRVWPALPRAPKLMIPDIQGSSTIGYDPGEYYPHHNLYWITSDEWPLLALKTLLRSRLVYRQVRAYSVQMRGGSVRFQAQTLRRVRLPMVRSLSDDLLARLTAVAESDRQAEIDELAEEAFAFG